MKTVKCSLNETETFAVPRPLQLQCSLSLRVHCCSSFGRKPTLLRVLTAVHPAAGITGQVTNALSKWCL